MIEEIKLNEDEYFGNVEAGSSIKLSRILEWMDKVGASKNASYLKCVVAKSGGCIVCNISDIMMDSNIVHKTATYAHGVKIALKESSSDDSMTIAHAAELFNAIATACEANGIDPDEVQVFVMETTGKLTRFSWYYDDQFDTAYIVRNMAPGAARKWLQAGAEVMAEVAKSPKKPSGSQDRELFAYWKELFGDDAAQNWKEAFPGKRVPRI